MSEDEGKAKLFRLVRLGKTKEVRHSPTHAPQIIAVLSVGLSELGARASARSHKNTHKHAYKYASTHM